MSDWAFSVIADPDYTRVVDSRVFDDVVLGAAAAAWKPRALSWWNDAKIGDVAHMSPELQLFSPSSAEELGLSEFGDLLPLTVEGTPYLLFDCTLTVPEDAVVDKNGSAYMEGNKLLLLQVKSTPPRSAPPVFRIAGQETFLIWTASLAKRIRKVCAGATVIPYGQEP